MTTFVVARDVNGVEIARWDFHGLFTHWRARRWIRRAGPPPVPMRGYGAMWSYTIENDPDANRALRDR